MNIFLWILQVLLAVLVLLAGIMKVTKSKDELNEANGMAWVESVSAGNLKRIGVLELLIAFGLILPQLTGILPWLTPLAAVGFAFTMIGAATLHVQRGESPAKNVVLLLLAAFVAYGRFVLIPA